MDASRLVGGAACASAVWFTGLGFGARLLAPVFGPADRVAQVVDTLVGLDDDYARRAAGSGRR